MISPRIVCHSAVRFYFHIALANNVENSVEKLYQPFLCLFGLRLYISDMLKLYKCEVRKTKQFFRRTQYAPVLHK